MGDDASTAYHADIMLDPVFDTGTPIRYDKELYTAFRNAMLKTQLQSSGVINTALGVNTVLHVNSKME